MTHLEKEIPPARELELDLLCMKVCSFAMFFADIDEAEAKALVDSFPAPERFYDGPPTVGDSKKFMVATLKAALSLLLRDA